MILQRVRKFWRAPLVDKLALAFAAVVMALAAAALRLLPYRWISPLLGEQVGPVGCVPLVDDRQEARARIIKLAVGRVARMAPFRSDCLPQAVTAAVMARVLAVPTAVHLGVGFDAGREIEAHAWTASGPVAVTGGDCFGAFSIVSCQLYRPRDRRGAVSRRNGGESACLRADLA